MKAIVHPSLPRAGRLICGPIPRSPRAEGVKTLRDGGVTVIACLIEDHEVPLDLFETYDAAGLEVVRFPIRDYAPPDDATAFAAFVDDLVTRLTSGQTVYLHCVGGLGRTGTVLACLLKTLGAGEPPVEVVRRLYDARAVESPAQRAFVDAFAG